MIKVKEGNITFNCIEFDIINIMSAFIESDEEFDEQFMKSRLLNMVEIACVIHGKNDENLTEADKEELAQLILDLFMRN